MRMERRPPHVTIIAWLMILGGAVGIVLAIVLLFNIDDPHYSKLIGVVVAVESISAVFTLIAGIFMLEGANWPRLAYAAWSVLVFLVLILTQPSGVVICSFVFRAFLIACLFTPDANRFFSPRRRGPGRWL
jgi:hypothetical protein